MSRDDQRRWPTPMSPPNGYGQLQRLDDLHKKVEGENG